MSPEGPVKIFQERHLESILPPKTLLLSPQTVTEQKSKEGDLGRGNSDGKETHKPHWCCVAATLGSGSEDLKRAEHEAEAGTRKE